MKKILHIIDSMGIGGAEKLLHTVIKELSGVYEQHLILLNEPDTLANDLREICKVTVLKFNPYKNMLGVKWKISGYIKTNGISIVHSQSFWSNNISRLASGKSVKVFNTIQAISSEASYKVNRLSLLLEKFTYSRRHYIIGVSKEVLDDFNKWVGLKGGADVIYNIIDDKFFKNTPKTTFSREGLKMVAVGNLRWQKNYSYLIEAFKTMPDNVSLDIYGEGDLRNELQIAIDKYKLKINLCGHRHDLDTVLSTYDVYVMSSLYEGFSLGLMEAMASGLPPLLSDIPVLREAGGETAVYFNLNNPEDLSIKVKELLENKDRLEKSATLAYQRARLLAKKEGHIEKLIKLYEKMP